MRCLLLALLLAAPACKGDEDRASGGGREPERPEVELAAALPAAFPLPASPGRTLVRSQSRLTMQVWQYAYTDLAATEVAGQLEAGLRGPGWQLDDAREAAGARHLVARHLGRSYVVTASTAAGVTSVTIRSFPEAGPTTTPAPAKYPATFPFLAGGTASHAPDGAGLRIAYQNAAADVEIAVVLAAQRAGWQCTGGAATPVTCTQDGATVSFTTRAVPGGSLLTVSSR